MTDRVGYPQFRRAAFGGVATRSGMKDPHAQTGPAFDPSYQPDVTQFRYELDGFAAHSIPFADANDQAAQTPASLSRIQCDYTPYPYTQALTTLPVLLIPRNPGRSNFYVINNHATDTIFISFGPLPPGLLGLPILAGAFFSEMNGVIGINDIFIAAAGTTAAAATLGYEGVPVIGSP